MSLALITGASAGLGAEFAKLFADDGHDLILVARRRDRLEEVARALKGLHSRLQVHVIDLDLGKPGAGCELFARASRCGEIDFLVNNAGFGNSGAFAQIPLERELELIDLNIRTLVETTRLFLPSMIQRGRGRILNLGSMAGFQPGPFMANYYASKAFVNHFSEALSEELRGTGVTCTLLAPGATRTEFASAAGLENSRLFKAGAASAVSVARSGYLAMLRGRTLKVPGLLNWLMVQSVRFSPRARARKAAGYFNQRA
ncbi:MAG: SDR family NAD(P)-dependent oxidoreductase [Bdellovibrionota bacterium]